MENTIKDRMQQIVKELKAIAIKLDELVDPSKPGKTLFYLKDIKRLCENLKNKIELLNLIFTQDSIFQINLKDLENFKSES